MTTPETYIVGPDDTPETHSVLDCALKRAKAASARLVMLHVLEWSPYSFLSAEELEQRHKRRGEELERARARAHIVQPALAAAKEAGGEATGQVMHGNIADLVARIAKEEEADMIFVGRSGSGATRSRIFGSVPLAIAQIATVPTVIVP